MPKRYLLSIDSGGIRGIIPAVALVKLEKTTGKLTRERTDVYFDNSWRWGERNIGFVFEQISHDAVPDGGGSGHAGSNITHGGAVVVAYPNSG